jgi:hypothetical protein
VNGKPRDHAIETGSKRGGGAEASTEPPLTPFSVIYYSNGQISKSLQQYCLNILAHSIATSGGEILCVTWEALWDGAPMTRNIIWPRHSSTHRNMYEQILAGVSEAQSDVIALAEHDVLYPVGYHDAIAKTAGGGLCYNNSVWCLNSQGFFRPEKCNLLSNCGGKRDVLVERIKEKLKEIQFRGQVEWAEPPADVQFSSPHPTVDVRHGLNFTGHRQAPGGNYLPQIEYWGNASTYTQLFATSI